MIPTPATRVPSVTSASSNTVTTAVASLTMAPRSNCAAGERARNDVPTRGQQMRADHRDDRCADPGKQVEPPLPLADDDRGKIRDHPGVEAAAREDAEQRPGHDDDNGRDHPD